MHSPIPPVDELAWIRAEMRRLKAREAVLHASLRDRDRDPGDARRGRPDTVWYAWEPFAPDGPGRPGSGDRRSVTLEARAEPAQADTATVRYSVTVP